MVHTDKVKTNDTGYGNYLLYIYKITTESAPKGGKQAAMKS